MGKERDKLIRQLGGTPVSDLNLSQDEIIQFAWDTYLKRGELPPTLREIIDFIEKKEREHQKR